MFKKTYLVLAAVLAAGVMSCAAELTPDQQEELAQLKQEQNDLMCKTLHFKDPKNPQQELQKWGEKVTDLQKQIEQLEPLTERKKLTEEELAKLENDLDFFYCNKIKRFAKSLAMGFKICCADSELMACVLWRAAKASAIAGVIGKMLGIDLLEGVIGKVPACVCGFILGVSIGLFDNHMEYEVCPKHYKQF